jgi:hypothetical protein
MSDGSVGAALRSAGRLVVIEAPAGCGKTFQGAKYAADIAATVGRGRVLVLTHTHAACDVFASATCGAEGNVEIRTIDSLISQIATAYHQALQLPADAAAWARISSRKRTRSKNSTSRIDGLTVLTRSASGSWQRERHCGLVLRLISVVSCRRVSRS